MLRSIVWCFIEIHVTSTTLDMNGVIAILKTTLQKEIRGNLKREVKGDGQNTSNLVNGTLRYSIIIFPASFSQLLQALFWHYRDPSTFLGGGWAIIYYDLEGQPYLLRQCLDPQGGTSPMFDSRPMPEKNPRPRVSHARSQQGLQQKQSPSPAPGFFTCADGAVVGHLNPICSIYGMYIYIYI